MNYSHTDFLFSKKFINSDRECRVAFLKSELELSIIKEESGSLYEEEKVFN